MTCLVPFTAIAVTTVQFPWFPSSFEWSRQPTAIGFLSYVPNEEDRPKFDFAVRIRTYDERRSLLTRWTNLNVPPGLWIGWDLRTDNNVLVAPLKDRPMSCLCRTTDVAGLIDLKQVAPYGHDLVMTCADADVRCDMRDPAEKFDDYYTSSYERAAAGIILDTVATFRLALSNVLGELRGGAQLRREVEMQMATGLADMVRQAISEVPVLSHLLDGSAPASQMECGGHPSPPLPGR